MTGGQSNNYDITLVNATLTVSKKDQVITLTDIDDKIVTDPSFDVTATVDSDLDLVYTLTGSATISGNTITLDGTTGTVTVTVSQAGNTNYNAVNATTTFEVNPVLSSEDLDNRDQHISKPCGLSYQCEECEIGESTVLHFKWCIDQNGQ